jgi:hypothetical protein
MLRIPRALVLAMVAIVALPVCAETFALKVSKQDKEVTATADPGGLIKDGVTDIGGNEPINIKVTCATAEACTNLSVQFRGDDVCKAAGTTCEGTIAKENVKLGDLVVSSGGKAIFSSKLKPPTSGTAATTAQKIPLTEMLRTPCRFRLPGDVAAYDRNTNEAYFVTDVLGNVKIAPEENVDENDRVHVIVFADTRLLPVLHVFRKSAIRTLGTVNLAGSGLTISVPTTTAQAIVVTTPKCSSQEYILTAFAPGKGEVQIDAETDDQTETVGNFEFLVDKLYDGIISAGITRSNLSDRDFKLVTQGDKKIIFATEEDGSNEYAVFLSAFLRRRDLEKAAQGPRDIIAPTIGISMKHPGDHAYVGLSANWKLFVFTVGEHFAHVTTLAKASGLHEGDAFTGAEADIPKAKRWKHATFFGVSMDLRAMTQFFATLGGAGGGH